MAGVQMISSLHVVQIFLHDNTAAAARGGVLVGDDRRLDHRSTAWILGTVDEPEEVAIVEVTKSMNFVDRRDRVAEARHDNGREFEAQIHVFARKWNSRSPGVDTARRSPARISRKGREASRMDVQRARNGSLRAQRKKASVSNMKKPRR
jgi:hypothetical protein